MYVVKRSYQCIICNVTFSLKFPIKETSPASLPQARGNDHLLSTTKKVCPPFNSSVIAEVSQNPSACYLSKQNHHFLSRVNCHGNFLSAHSNFVTTRLVEPELEHNCLWLACPRPCPLESNGLSI